MGTLDWVVIGIFFLALIGIIVWVVKQKQNDSADYFLGGRDATWLAIGASIFASNIGSEHLIGLAGAGASSGMAMAHLGNTRLDDLDSRMGIRTILFTKHGIHNARISGTPLQSAVAYYSFCHFINQLRADQSSCNCICRWTCIPAGVWYQRTVGNRFLLDCSNRFSCIDSTFTQYLAE